MSEFDRVYWLKMRRQQIKTEVQYSTLFRDRAIVALVSVAIALLLRGAA